MTYNFIGVLIVSGISLLAVVFWSQRRRTWLPQQLLVLAVILRIVGSTVRYEVLHRYYHGLGDAVVYYYEGLHRSGYLASGGPSVFSTEFWIPYGTWWGTAFLTRVSAVVLTLIGPSMRGEFLAFSLLALVGLYLIATAFRNIQPGPQALAFAAWILCWPSLLYWPSSIGKEALILLAIGLFFYGYAGDGQRIRWLPFALGFGLAFSIRPHVAAVLALAAMAAYWLASWTRWTTRRLLESVVAVVIALVALQGMAAQFGFDLTDAEGMQEFVEFRAGQTQSGGSQIAPVSTGPAGIPMAFVNIWMRPFPWDVHNATALLAAVEVLVFWWLVWKRRREVGLALRHWRKHRLLRFALPLLLAYTLMIGLTFSNLGIIARQRSPIYPFMFMVILAAPEPAAVKRKAPVRAPQRRRLPAPAAT